MLSSAKMLQAPDSYLEYTCSRMADVTCHGAVQHAWATDSVSDCNHNMSCHDSVCDSHADGSHPAVCLVHAQSIWDSVTYGRPCSAAI